MTILVKFANSENRWNSNLTYNIDKDDVLDLDIDYSGEIGADTVSTATTSAKNITAGTPSITANVVTIQLSAGSEDTKATLDVTMTTTASKVLSRTITFKVRDL